MKMTKKKKIEYEANTLYALAEQYRKYPIPEEEIENNDMTALLDAEEDEMIKRGEIIIEQINAKMRLGKSTMGIKRGLNIFKKLQRHGYRSRNSKFGMKNIARDDQEYSKLMRDPNLAQTCIVTDEGNELEGTGENVTVERALKKVFSDVQAGRYVHRINCAPRDTLDPNTDIILNVISINHKAKTTRAKLYYRYFEGGIEYTQLLGYVDTYVGDIIKRWEEIKKVFYKTKKTEKDKEIIEQARKEDFYVEYMIKKYEKMELITKEGIFKPRILDYAEAIANAINELQDLTKIPSVLNKDLVKNQVKIEFRNLKIPTSIVGDQLATNEAYGLLKLYESYYKINRDINKINDRRTNPKSKINLTTAQEQIDELTKIKATLIKSIEAQKTELERYISINKEYHEMNSDGITTN